MINVKCELSLPPLPTGVEPRMEAFTGADAVGFIADKNLKRRHLTVGQKAMAVAKYDNPFKRSASAEPRYRQAGS